MTAAKPLKLAYSEVALSFLEGLPKKPRGQIIEKINRLTADSRPPGCKLVQGMQTGTEPVYRIRSGDYRVLYVVRDSTLIVLDIGHRKDIYR